VKYISYFNFLGRSRLQILVFDFGFQKWHPFELHFAPHVKYLSNFNFLGILRLQPTCV
jgi:hypothetical protein